MLFVGGGLGKKEVESAIAKERSLSNIDLAPLQPLADLQLFALGG